jgi:hypothetical protein
MIPPRIPPSTTVDPSEKLVSQKIDIYNCESRCTIAKSNEPRTYCIVAQNWYDYLEGPLGFFIVLNLGSYQTYNILRLANARS